VAPPDGLASSLKIVSLALPSKSKQTVLIEGAPAQAAAELVRRLREEARVL
jgi:electron transfer flavoprotein alpha/beta subunit